MLVSNAYIRGCFERCVCVLGGGGGLKGLQNLQALNDSPSMFTIH